MRASGASVRPPALVAVAHGSRRPAPQQAVESLLDLVRAQLRGVAVHAAYVQHGHPSLPDVLARVGRNAVVVPLLLSRGYHATYDVARVAGAAGVAVTATLGPDPALCDALLDRVAQSRAPADAPVVLAAAGSADPRATADVEQQARALARRRGVAVLAGYASAARPSVDEAVRAVRAGTGRLPVLAPYLIGRGHFCERIDATETGWVAEPLGAHPAVAALVTRRYLEAAYVTATA